MDFWHILVRLIIRGYSSHLYFYTFTNSERLDTALDAIIEEVWVNGQQQDVWCRSQRPITDLVLYAAKAPYIAWRVPSCYYFYNTVLAHRTSDECGPYGKTGSAACCLCM